MRVVESLPRPVREIEHCWIPLSDGCRLAARLWLPEGAEREPVPAILEYLPYGKREGTRERDEPMHRYFAGHGYAAVRVDLRGSGDSEGLLRDEYLEQELRDGMEVIGWIASRAWCTGAVGMIGKSWGGFNALQIAALRPPALRGLISVCASDDRYADDAHYMGGCLLTENFRWGATLFALVAQPPDPDLLGERWRTLWRERLEAAGPPALGWLAHPLRDDYWRHGSVAEDLARIVCPVYAVGGWADGYSNAVPRLVAGLTAPCKGLLGPWGHLYPHQGVPGPAIGFLQEALRWWDHCLRGVENGILDEPAYRVWMQDGVAPADVHPRRAGRWVAEAGWPSPRLRSQRLYLGKHGLAAAPPSGGAARSHRTGQATGLTAGSWCGFGAAHEMPGDQREDDARSLCFDSPPLPDRLEILGAPVLRLCLAVDRPVAFVAARLTDVAPDGTSAFVTYGLQNLTHDDAHADVRVLAPGERREVTFALNDIAHAFPAGNRVRLALATSHWPLVWPSPEPLELVLFCDGSWLDLPVRPPRPEDERLPPFATPEAAPGPSVRDLDPHGVRRRIERSEPGEVVYTTEYDLVDGRPARSRIEAIDLDVGYGVRERMRIRDDDPLTAEAETEHLSTARRGDWSVEVETRQRVTASAGSFRLEAELRAREGGREVFARRWDERVPRKGI